MKPSRCSIMAEPYCVLTRSNSRILYFLSISRSAILVYPLVHSLKTCFRDSIVDVDVDKRRAGYNTCAQAGSQAENDGGHWWWWGLLTLRLMSCLYSSFFNSKKWPSENS